MPLAFFRDRWPLWELLRATSPTGPAACLMSIGFRRRMQLFGLLCWRPKGAPERLPDWANLSPGFRLGLCSCFRNFLRRSARIQQ